MFYGNLTGIALNNAGDTVNFIDVDGATVIDSHQYDSSSPDVSIGRLPDGSSTWITFTEPTPGGPNGSGSGASNVCINEFLPQPAVVYTLEWIELYNPLDVDVNLSGYVLDDITDGGTSPYTIPNGTIISAHGFLVFYSNVTGIALNNDGDTVNLLEPDGVTVVDSFSYTSSTDDVSIGRLPDGGGTWTTFSNPTPGSSNSGSLLYYVRLYTDSEVPDGVKDGMWPQPHLPERRSKT